MNIIINDGRNHLALTDKLYDVIISEPSNPWIAGTGDLFTREFFQLCRQRLSDQGVMCIWSETYSFDIRSFSSVVGTFRSVFPEMTLWCSIPNTDFLLIGWKGQPAVDCGLFSRRMANEPVAADLQRINIRTMPELLGNLVMGTAGAAKLSRDAPIHTDDNALLEFATPRSYFQDPKATTLVTRPAIEKSREADFSFLRAAADDAKLLATVTREASRYVQARGRLGQAAILLAQGRKDQSLLQYQAAAALWPSYYFIAQNLTQRFSKGKKALREKQYPLAIKIFQELSFLKPDESELHFFLAHSWHRNGNAQKAIEQYRRALELAPDSIETLNSLAWILAMHPDSAIRDGPEAVRLAKKACQYHGSPSAELLATLGAAYATDGRFADAQTTLQKALELALAADKQDLVMRLRKQIAIYQQRQSHLKSTAPSRLPSN